MFAKGWWGLTQWVGGCSPVGGGLSRGWGRLYSKVWTDAQMNVTGFLAISGTWMASYATSIWLLVNEECTRMKPFLSVCMFSRGQCI